MCIRDSKIVIWEIGSNTERAVFETNVGSRDHIIFHPLDPCRLASTNVDGAIELWDVSSTDPKRIRTLHAHTGRVSRIRFNDDGSKLVSGSYTDVATALLWDVETGHILTRFIGHTDRVADVDISPDDQWVATASRDFTVRLWDAKSGVELRRFTEHNEDVFCVEFIDDGRQLVSCGGDGLLRFRDIKTAEEVLPSLKQLQADTSLFLDGDRIRSLPRRAQWYVTDQYSPQ